ncbi:hypothetical protein DPEC_G00299570 [Dallia pectoralis]|uniref:Uncharacterized protein n=1 Tax=Dallia pectoralis TaxID=75939 RepID=A0ACC2FG15_DALPE|nr:hypothetical protein DPEC_G00299570 [Dallia pectoralis]
MGAGSSSEDMLQLSSTPVIWLQARLGNGETAERSPPGECGTRTDLPDPHSRLLDDLSGLYAHLDGNTDSDALGQMVCGGRGMSSAQSHEGRRPMPCSCCLERLLGPL